MKRFRKHHCTYSYIGATVWQFQQLVKKLISVVRQHCRTINKSLPQSTVTLNTWIRICFEVQHNNKQLIPVRVYKYGTSCSFSMLAKFSIANQCNGLHCAQINTCRDMHRDAKPREHRTLMQQYLQCFKKKKIVH